MTVIPNDRSATGEKIFPRCKSEPRGFHSSYSRLWALRLEPKSLNIFPSPFAKTNIVMREPSPCQSYEMMRYYRTKHARRPEHLPDRFEEPFATSFEHGWRHKEASKRHELIWFPMKSSSMTKFQDHLCKDGVKLKK